MHGDIVGSSCHGVVFAGGKGGGDAENGDGGGCEMALPASLGVWCDPGELETLLKEGVELFDGICFV